MRKQITATYKKPNGEIGRLKLWTSDMGEPLLPADKMHLATSLEHYCVKGFALSGAAYLTSK